MTDDEIDELVGKVRDLGRLAGAAGAAWRPVSRPPAPPGDDPIEDVPDNDREVLVFLNGHVDVHDTAGRTVNGAVGGWGVRLGFVDEDGDWRVGARGHADRVTHWMELPAPPARP